MNLLMIENLNLLNKMNEGLIVVAEEDQSLKVVNKPAKSLLKQTKSTMKDGSDSNKIIVDQNDMNKPLFNLNQETVRNINDSENPKSKKYSIELE